jgi:AmmeMemoRadiSam system protein B
MITFAAIVPHPPLLLPTIGKDAVKKLAQTQKALEQLEQELYLARPDTLLIISPHGPVMPDAFVIDIAAQYQLDFKEVGDFQTTKTVRSDFLLIDRIQRNARKETPVVLANEESLGYGIGIPFLFLSAHLPNVTIVPVFTSTYDLKTHYAFGKLLKEEILNSNKRIAVIASADLAHTLTKDAPGGLAVEGQQVDTTVQQFLTNKNTAGLLTIDHGLLTAAKACGVQPITTLLGVLEGIGYDPKIYSYEFPFGIGYLVSNLVLS